MTAIMTKAIKPRIADLSNAVPLVFFRQVSNLS